jgi:diaminobutyrate-2-oxoglutarate transaminase
MRKNREGSEMENWKKFRELSFTDAPRIKVVPPGPGSQEILKMQKQLEGSAVSYPVGMPMALARGRGATLEDVDGNIFIDCFSGAGVMALGHAHPVVLEAAHEQIDKLTHTLDIPSESRMRMVRVLRRILPEELCKVFFGGPTGSDAIEQAVKLAKFNTGRFGMIAFEGSYHGMTGAALALTSDSGHRDGLGPLVPGVQYIPFPYKYRNPFGCPDHEIDEFAADNLERVLDDSHSGYSKPAAVLLEAVQGEGGTIIPAPRFLQRVREITKAHGILMICDEIQSGLGRTGKMFSFEHAGIVPDIITISKALGGAGFPISAIAYREELDTMPPGKSIGTFRGNMVAFAAGAAGLEWMIDNRVPDYAAELGQKVMTRFRDIERNSNILGEARGIGLMIALEMVEDKQSRKPATEITRKLRKLAHQRGVMIEVGGHYGNVARLLPPLVISEDLMMKAVDILEEVIRDIETGA